MSDTRFKPVDAPITEPPKRWFNWWLITQLPLSDKILVWKGKPTRIGSVHCSGVAHPTREIAEQKAIEADAKELRQHGMHYSKWLGAYPEGERP